MGLTKSGRNCLHLSFIRNPRQYYYCKMPTEMSSWADEIDETDTSLILPPPSEKWVGNQKITTEYAHNDDGKKVKIIRTFKIEKKLVSKAVARRKALAKLGCQGMTDQVQTQLPQL